MLTHLAPEKIWFYFDEITRIPRPSKKEQRIIDYLLAFGKQHNLETKVDAVGNVLICKDATMGMEGCKTVILQSHVDMVCEKNSDKIHNFDTDPIQTFIDGEWVKARGTTLGADDGIGMAAQLAVLASDDLQHGKIECLFTVDEETGLTGAFALKEGFMSGEILLNLDSEDEGELYIGCAGGVDTVATLEYNPEPAGSNLFAVKISVKGLKGGHSGDDINKGLGNAVKILNRFLWELDKKLNIFIASIDGGNLRNALAREATATLLIPSSKKEEVRTLLNIYTSDIESIYAATEPGLRLIMESTDYPEFVIDRDTQNKLLNVLYACPHGVLAMSSSIPGLVETSTNLASVKLKSDNLLEIVTSQRSSVEAARKGAKQMVSSVFGLVGATVRHSDGYPGWNPNPKSPVLQIAKTVYENTFGLIPDVKAIHAGLECGLFLEKYPRLDMVSFGPTIKGAHSPDERLHIQSVEKFWKLLIGILASAPQN
jgi:dipeptidase D